MHKPRLGSCQSLQAICHRSVLSRCEARLAISGASPHQKPRTPTRFFLLAPGFQLPASSGRFASSQQALPGGLHELCVRQSGPVA
jgi:hypothetical protein